MSRLHGAPQDSVTYAFIALGSNLGDSQRNIYLAAHDLEEHSEGPMLASSLWETTPVDCPPGSPIFVNAVVRILPRLGETPESLLVKLRQLERRYGRETKQILNEARPLDLDLIVFGGEILATGNLTLPHPRATSRRFVLEPLNEIAPGLVFPGEMRTVAELLADLPPDPAMRKIGRIQTSRA
jgi:2-amino-4-hydroxy-6-hydroxymethyldihydropteridine diphosphokinase